MTDRRDEPLGLALRHPDETDQPAVAAVVDEWLGRRARPLVARFWFEHFGSTCWLAETGRGRLAGFLVGFLSPDHRDVACLLGVATNPNLRRRGIGTALVERFAEAATTAGARAVTCTIPPDERVALTFLRAAGFEAVRGPGTRTLYGVPAYPDYEFAGEDRAVLVRELGPGPDAGSWGAPRPVPPPVA